MKEIMEAAVRHLHAFAREVNLTPGEWIKGIEFMTKVGQMCTPARQEFILLSDTVGLSALVNIMHDKTKMEEATGASLLGPFFRENTPRFESGAQIAKNRRTARRSCSTAASAMPRASRLPNAQVTVWQTAADGRYDIQKGIEEIDCRGIFRTDDKGNYLIRTVRPLRLFHPARRSRRADGHGPEAPRHAARAHPLPDQRAGLSRARHGALSRRRRASGGRRGVRRLRRPGRRGQGQRPGLARSKACPASTSISAWRARARPTGAPAASAAIRARSPPATARRPRPTARRRRRCCAAEQAKKGGFLGGLFRGK